MAIYVYLYYHHNANLIEFSCDDPSANLSNSHSTLNENLSFSCSRRFLASYVEQDLKTILGNGNYIKNDRFVLTLGQILSLYNHNLSLIFSSESSLMSLQQSKALFQKAGIYKFNNTTKFLGDITILKSSNNLITILEVTSSNPPPQPFLPNNNMQPNPSQFWPMQSYINMPPNQPQFWPMQSYINMPPNQPPFWPMESYINMQPNQPPFWPMQSNNSMQFLQQPPVNNNMQFLQQPPVNNNMQFLQQPPINNNMCLQQTSTSNNNSNQNSSVGTSANPIVISSSAPLPTSLQAQISSAWQKLITKPGGYEVACKDGTRWFFNASVSPVKLVAFNNNNAKQILIDKINNSNKILSETKKNYCSRLNVINDPKDFQIAPQDFQSIYTLKDIDAEATGLIAPAGQTQTHLPQQTQRNNNTGPQQTSTSNNNSTQNSSINTSANPVMSSSATSLLTCSQVQIDIVWKKLFSNPIGCKVICKDGTRWSINRKVSPNIVKIVAFNNNSKPSLIDKINNSNKISSVVKKRYCSVLNRLNDLKDFTIDPKDFESIYTIDDIDAKATGLTIIMNTRASLAGETIESALNACLASIEIRIGEDKFQKILLKLFKIDPELKSADVKNIRKDIADIIIGDRDLQQVLDFFIEGANGKDAGNFLANTFDFAGNNPYQFYKIYNKIIINKIVEIAQRNKKQPETQENKKDKNAVATQLIDVDATMSDDQVAQEAERIIPAQINAYSLKRKRNRDSDSEEGNGPKQPHQDYDTEEEQDTDTEEEIQNENTKQRKLQ
ncbi:MAG: hypothetical protein JSS07_03665 [Proteobacteria bacterium]|nr:hypothetical protein [Pseudomonadota bacterium]